MFEDIKNIIAVISVESITISLFFVVFMLLILFIVYFSGSRDSRKKLSYLLEAANERFKVLSKINDLILYSSSMNDVLRIIVDEIVKTFPSAVVSILTFNNSRDSLVQVVSSENENTSLDIADFLYNKQPDAYETLMGKRTYETNSLMQQGLLPYSECFFVPLIKGSEVIGVLAVMNKAKSKHLIKEEKAYLGSFAGQVSVILESKRLLEYGNLYKEELAGVNSITEVGLMALAADEALEILINRFAGITRSSAGKLFLLNQKTGELQSRARTNYRFTRDEDAADFELAKECAAECKITFGNGRKTCLPLKIDRKAFGSLLLYRERPDEKEMKSITNLADKASIVIERSLSYEASANIVNDLSAISYLGNMILSTVNLEEVLNLIVRSICEMMEAKGCALRLLNEDSTMLELHAAYGLSSRYLENSNVSALNSTEGRVVNSRQIAAVPDLSAGDYENKASADAEDIKSLLCVPLMAKNRVTGVLTVFFRTKRNFTDNDKKIILIYASQTAIAIENARLFASGNEMYLNVMKSFADALDAKDNYTRGHSEDVTGYAMEIAKEMNLPESEVELLRFSAILHDIGKIGIDDKILKKDDILTPGEYEKIKNHPYIASRILENIKEFRQVSEIIVHHHERFDGSGYPGKLKQKEIPALSRIITVVDAYEAMTSDRPYRKKMSLEAARMELVRCKETQFDPEIVDVFTRVLAKKARKHD